MTIRKLKPQWKVMLIVAGVMAISIAGLAEAGRGGRGKKTFGTVFVKTQGLYYDTFAAADALPYEGPFQDIYVGPDGIGQTDYGPGDKNYVGGRWQVVDPVTHEPTGTYFLCPLLGPGRTSP